MSGPGQDTPTISASRLKMVGKCERQYAGAYLFGLKQGTSPALERGTALHSAAEDWQATGVVPFPESTIGTLLAAGTHLIEQCGKLLVEYEHQGELPDGTSYLAYFDGHSETADPQIGTVIVQDLKTTGSAARALTPDTLLTDEQAMFYAWILLCSVHRFRKDEQSEWQVWDPAARYARTARLRWIYFLTAGNPRAWESTVFVSPERAEAYMRGTIMPLVRKIRAIHDWRATNPGASLDDYAREMEACGGEGKWCGVGERDACEMHLPGTPAEQLIQLRTRTQPIKESERNTMTDNARMLALRAKYASKTAAPAVAVEEPAAPESAVETVAAPVEETPAPAPVAPVEAPVAEAPVRARKPRTPAPAAPPEGAAGVNPPEAIEALAKLNAETALPVTAAVPSDAADKGVAAFTTEQIVDLLIARGYTVALNRAGQSA